MIVFAAITPHPPIIIPEIGKENLSFVEKTIRAMKKLSEELYAAKPDTIVFISPHGPMLADAFTINMAPEFKINFEDFGDLKTNFQVKGDLGLIHHYKEMLEDKMAIVLTNQEKLDHGVGVPLYFFAQGLDLEDIRIVPISYSLQNHQTHFDFGRRLQEDMLNDTKRIAVVASGDLSHRLTQDAPAGYSHWAKKFDATLIEKIKTKDVNGIMNLDPDFIEEAEECGLKSIIILLGILNSINYTPEVYSYEGPFGVGYLTTNFKFNII